MENSAGQFHAVTFKEVRGKLTIKSKPPTMVNFK